MNSFKKFNIDPHLTQALTANSILEPTLVQDASIPLFLEKKNFISLASTGSGKTIAFLLPLVHAILNERKKTNLAKALVLVPTRELGMQVLKNFKMLANNTDLTAALIIGGDKSVEQARTLRKGADIIIATPGRFIDMWERGHLLLSSVRYLILDEADRMADMGFYPELRKIISLLQTPIHYSLFSATMPSTITELVNSFIYKPEFIKINNPDKTASTIEQFLAKLEISPQLQRKNKGYVDFVKRSLLRYLLEKESPDSAIIFCNRKKNISILNKSLLRYGFNCLALHGDMTQSDRFKNLESFTAGNSKILIASDVAARGLDIPNVSHVFNFDIPLSQDDYIHRIGRTGRAGKSGRALTLSLHQKEYDSLSSHIKEVATPLNLSEFNIPSPLKSTSTNKVANKEKSNIPTDLKNTQKEEESPQGFGRHIPAFFEKEITLVIE